VIAEEAPGLEEALERAMAEGTPYVILDGKIVSSVPDHWTRPPGLLACCCPSEVSHF
jgi:hypothetical protein